MPALQEHPSSFLCCRGCCTFCHLRHSVHTSPCTCRNHLLLQCRHGCCCRYSCCCHHGFTSASSTPPSRSPWIHVQQQSEASQSPWIHLPSQSAPSTNCRQQWRSRCDRHSHLMDVSECRLPVAICEQCFDLLSPSFELSGGTGHCESKPGWHRWDDKTEDGSKSHHPRFMDSPRAAAAHFVQQQQQQEDGSNSFDNTDSPRPYVQQERRHGWKPGIRRSSNGDETGVPLKPSRKIDISVHACKVRTGHPVVEPTREMKAVSAARVVGSRNSISFLEADELSSAALQSSIRRKLHSASERRAAPDRCRSESTAMAMDSIPSAHDFKHIPAAFSSFVDDFNIHGHRSSTQHPGYLEVETMAPLKHSVFSRLDDKIHRHRNASQHSRYVKEKEEAVKSVKFSVRRDFENFSAFSGGDKMPRRLQHRRASQHSRYVDDDDEEEEEEEAMASVKRYSAEVGIPKIPAFSTGGIFRLRNGSSSQHQHHPTYVDHDDEEEEAVIPVKRDTTQEFEKHPTVCSSDRILRRRHRNASQRLCFSTHVEEGAVASVKRLAQEFDRMRTPAFCSERIPRHRYRSSSHHQYVSRTVGGEEGGEEEGAEAMASLYSNSDRIGGRPWQKQLLGATTMVPSFLRRLWRRDSGGGINSAKRLFASDGNIVVNGEVLSKPSIESAEKRAGNLRPGRYWYDCRAGFWGVMGGPCLGVLPPFIEELSHAAMPSNCSNGTTQVYVNGRELHAKDLEILSDRGLPRQPGLMYVLEFDGMLMDALSGKELPSLGKLAPTVQRRGKGFGMYMVT